MTQKEIEDAARQSSIDNLGRLSPAHELGFEKGVAWMRERMIDQACEWIRQTYMGDYAEDDVHNSVDFDTETFVEDFKQAMTK